MSNKLNFKDVLEAAPDAMVGIDQGGTILFVNRQTMLLFGYDRDDLVESPGVIVAVELRAAFTGQHASR